MKVWLPSIDTGGGAAVWTRAFADTLGRQDHQFVEYLAPHSFQYWPRLQRAVAVPAGTDVTLAHSWFGFAFDRPGIPLVVTEHLFTPDPIARLYRNPLQTVFHEHLVRRYVAESYRSAAAIVAVSAATLKQIQTHFPWARPRLIPNGIDLEFFRPAPRADRRADVHAMRRPVRLLFVGNLIRRKGVDLLAPIMARLGDGFELHYTSGLRTRDPQRDIPNGRPLGTLDKEGMRQAYWDADILLFPSRLEGLPLAVLEAAGCGLPAVVSDASSLPETVIDGTTGRISPADDVDGFVDAVRQLADDPAALITMGEAARALAEQRFDLCRMTRQYVELFDEVRESSA